MHYKTNDGDILDKICYDTYGFTNNSFESVLFNSSNYDKTSVNVFNAGTVIELPAIEPAKKKTQTMLWE